MPSFHFTAVGTEGKPETGVIKSPSMDDAVKAIVARQLTVLDLHEAGTQQATPWYARDIQFFGTSLSDGEAAAVARHISLFLGAGFTTLETLRMSADLSQAKATRDWLNRLAERVGEGVSLADALQDNSKGAPELFCVMAEVGERTNTLADTMQAAANFFANKAANSTKTRGILLYPAILVVAAIAVLLVVTFVLIPAVAPIFMANGREMPAILAILASVSNASFGEVGRFVVSTSGIIALLFLARRPLGGFMKNLPVVRAFFAMSSEARFATHARLLSLITRAGETGSGMFSQLQRASAQSRISDLFVLAEQEVRQGRLASQVFSADQRTPAVFAELFAAGEKANTLSAMMELAADILEERVKQRSERYLQLLTPILTLTIGILIGGVVYSIMSAILDVTAFTI